MKAAALLVVAGCWTASAPSTAIEKHPLVLDERGLSPLDAHSIVTREALADALPEYEVKPDGEGSGFVYNVLDRGELLFYVVPTGKQMFGIHVKSPRVAGPHGWHVGAAFADVELVETCECWGNQDVQVCYKRGTHVAVLFERSKHGLPCTSNPHGIAGKRIDRLVWQPGPWGDGK